MTPNNILYRYRPINQYTLDELINYYIFFPAAHRLNDPFELNAYYKEYSADPKSFFKEYEKIGYKVTEGFDWRKVKEIITDKIKGQIENRLKKYQNKGVCCFTKSPKDIRMWSHYAMNHSGLCIGYDIRKIEQYHKMIEISYEDCMPKPKNGEDGIIDVDIFFQELIRTKSKVWESENEVRLIHEESDKRFFIDDNVIVEIYFGIQTKKEDAETIGRLVYERNPKTKFFKLFKAGNGKYELGEALLIYDSTKRN